MKTKTLHALWLEFERACVHPDTSATDRLRLREAFYAGASQVVTLVAKRYDLRPEDITNQLAIYAEEAADFAELLLHRINTHRN